MMPGMTTPQLTFDRVGVDGVRLHARLPDGALFAVDVRNVGEGFQEGATVLAEGSGTAIAILTREGQPSGAALDWIATNVLRTANAHPNDGQKLRALVAGAPLQYDSRHILD
jgi:hypothetical protein